MKVYEAAIIKSLCYSEVFSFPLTDSELWRFLIWERGMQPNFLQFKKILRFLDSKGIIFNRGGYYFLNSQSKHYKKRHAEELLYVPYGQMAKRVAHVLSFIPTVEMVGLSGKLALGVSDYSDDIDLFIVTSDKTVFLTRLVVWLILSIAGVNRVNKKYVRNRVCTNMFCDLRTLSLPKEERDIYSAHEVAQLRVLYDRGGVYSHFRSVNRWIYYFLPNLPVPREVVIRRAFHMRVIAFLTSLLEPLFYLLQKLYMKRKITTEVVKRDYVRFHPNDARLWIIPRYKKLVESYL